MSGFYTDDEQESMNLAKATAYELIDQSRARISTYSRERFGSFATNDSQFASIEAKLRYLHTQMADTRDMEERPRDSIYESYLRSHWMNLMGSVGVGEARAAYDYGDQTAAEIYLLWSVTPSDAMYGVTYISTDDRDGTHSDVLLMWFERYKNLYRYPAFLPFYERGIFDITVIVEAIANDIDPELLVSAVNA